MKEWPRPGRASKAGCLAPLVFKFFFLHVARGNAGKVAPELGRSVPRGGHERPVPGHHQTAHGILVARERLDRKTRRGSSVSKLWKGGSESRRET